MDKIRGKGSVFVGSHFPLIADNVSHIWLIFRSSKLLERALDYCGRTRRRARAQKLMSKKQQQMISTVLYLVTVLEKPDIRVHIVTTCQSFTCFLRDKVLRIRYKNYLVLSNLIHSWMKSIHKVLMVIVNHVIFCL